MVDISIRVIADDEALLPVIFVFSVPRNNFRVFIIGWFSIATVPADGFIEHDLFDPEAVVPTGNYMVGAISVVN